MAEWRRPVPGDVVRVLIAGSFGEVFRDNCIRNGILPIVAAIAGSSWGRRSRLEPLRS